MQCFVSIRAGPIQALITSSSTPHRDCSIPASLSSGLWRGHSPQSHSKALGSAIGYKFDTVNSSLHPFIVRQLPSFNQALLATCFLLPWLGFGLRNSATLQRHHWQSGVHPGRVVRSVPSLPRVPVEPPPEDWVQAAALRGHEKDPSNQLQWVVPPPPLPWVYGWPGEVERAPLLNTTLRRTLTVPAVPSAWTLNYHIGSSLWDLGCSQIQGHYITHY